MNKIEKMAVGYHSGVSERKAPSTDKHRRFAISHPAKKMFDDNYNCGGKNSCR